MRPRTVAIIAFILVFLGALIPVGRAIYIVHTTGGLHVTTTDSTATLAVSGTNKQAVYIGQGTAKVRLAPGTYLVSATDQGTTVSTMVQVAKRQTTTKSLDISGRIKATSKYNSLYSKLPISGPASTYVISYYLTYNKGVASPIFTVASTSDTAKVAAQNWFEYYGFNPADLDIHYTSTEPSTSSSAPNGPSGGTYYFGSSNVGA